ncbi:MAG: hypothetical protein O2968_22085 [Acidobacteria bacterium]|nr:hypothetical protein [Acidobacteriota bacterium]
MIKPIRSQTVEHRFLTHAASEVVYQYLGELARLSIPLSRPAALKGLHERKDPVINLALSSFSADAEVLNEVFADGDIADLIAICGNPNLPGLRWIADEDFKQLIEEGPDEALRLLFTNPSQAPDELCKVLEREGIYSQISDSGWFRVLGFALWHPYLGKPAPDTPYLRDLWGGPGNEERPFRAVWRLLLILPTEEVHARSLDNVLNHLGEFILPHGFEMPGVPGKNLTERDFMPGVPGKNLTERDFLNHVLRRWAVAGEQDEESAFFHLRTVISRLAAEHDIYKKSGGREFFLKHEDAAVRRGFYEVCSPEGRDEFTRWLERDPRNFIWGFISNSQAYQSESDAKTAFSELCRNKTALKRHLNPDEVERFEYEHIANEHASYIKTEAESVYAVHREIDLDEGERYVQTKRIAYTDIEGLANKVDKLASQARTSTDSTGSLAEALSTASLMAKFTNENLLAVAKDLATRAAKVERRLDRYETNLEDVGKVISKAFYWIGGAIALSWVARNVWQALTD